MPGWIYSQQKQAFEQSHDPVAVEAVMPMIMASLQQLSDSLQDLNMEQSKRDRVVDRINSYLGMWEDNCDFLMPYWIAAQARKAVEGLKWPPTG